MDQPDDTGFLQWLTDMLGFRDPKLLGDGRYACIVPRFLRSAIVTGYVADVGFEDSWKYRSYPEAKRALDAWDGQGEPTGWIRHQATRATRKVAAENLARRPLM
jgi:hypothetical protein